MSFEHDGDAFRQELDAYYAKCPADTSDIEKELHRLGRTHCELLPCQRKAMGYELMAERCPVKVFRYFPFYFEFHTGRHRTDLGGGGLGPWMKREPSGASVAEAGAAWWAPCSASGLSEGWLVLDDNHHCLGYDNILEHGLLGLIRLAEQRLLEVTTDRQREFLHASIVGNRALITISNRLADEAEAMRTVETDPAVKSRLERIARTARRVPAEPPSTFYEALNTLLFMREVSQSIEGNGISIIGHLDRVLLPYYRNDLADGRMSPDEAHDLLGFFLAFSDAHFGMSDADPWHLGTNGTVTIGGCNAEGDIIFNELTRMIIGLHMDMELVDPKLNARVSAEHPREYIDLLARHIAAGRNNLAVFNDDVVIPANTRMGKALADCRLYAGGGCQENVLENTEINSRATIYLNMAHVLLMGFFPQDWQWFSTRDNVELATYNDCTTFNAFYAVLLNNLAAVVNAHIEQRNCTEQEGWQYNPCPLESSTIDDCISNARGMMEGGARYSFGSVSLAGIGTIIDSLYAICTAVFTQQKVSLQQMSRLLASDFKDAEPLRQYLRNRIPKFGQADEGIREFSRQVFSDLARVSSGKPNTRGGVYEASLFSFRSFTTFGNKTGATPDGRKAGQHLSAGMSPSPLAMAHGISAGDLLHAIEPADLTDYPVVAVLDLKMPVMPGRTQPCIIAAVIQQFIDCGGSVLQVNYLDQAALIEARHDPEKHPGLVVRVSGYSSYFNQLADPIKDEIIERAIVQS